MGRVYVNPKRWRQLLLPGVLLISFLSLTINPLKAQYFGQNKSRYKSFDFKVTQSPHFELYHYFQDEELREDLLQNSEHWYHLHQEIFQDTFRKPNPLIFYQNHPDFQQTTVINGLIGEGTGGVTEGLKNRVIMPMMYSHRQTDHVLGHELVHAFQYHSLINGDSTNLASIRNIPLWMVEGLAEYMSIGRTDPHTAMWMRDAVLHRDIPSIKDLNNPKYFPYRYGQAFWAFVTGLWGDGIIRPLFVETARLGYENAFKKVLGVNSKNLSHMWKSALENAYRPLLKDSSAMVRPPGKMMVSALNGGEMNVSPVLSPDGKYLAFLSEKNVISIDAYIIDTRTGQLVKQIAKKGINNHIDAYSFLESSGSWSPDSRKYAMVIFSKGKNKLLITDLETNKEEIREIPGVEAFSDPAWSPDGESVVVSGLVDGYSDLFLFDLYSGKVKKLTNDKYSDLQPAWSSDGKFITFTTDRIGNPERLEKAHLSIAVLDVDRGDVASVHVFHGADNMNPVFAPGDTSIYFLSNRDGFRNMYRYDLEDAQVYQLTDLYTGVSGITAFSPALSVAFQQGAVAYSYYSKNSYQIFLSQPDQFKAVAVESDQVDQAAAHLPVYGTTTDDIVEPNLATEDLAYILSEDSIKNKAYKPQFKLDYLGNTGLGLGVSNFGTGLAGGVNMLFSDILGNNQIFATVALNGEIYDLGGQVAYINQKNKIQWGLGLSHIPYRASLFGFGVDTINVGGGQTAAVNALYQDNFRQFEEKFSLFAAYPFSKTQRVEAGASAALYSFRIDRIKNYYDAFGNFIGQDRENFDAPEGYGLQQTYVAYVGDNSRFGMTAPLDGMRYRIQADKYFGELDFYSLLVDFRKYHYIKPVSLGFRLYHYARLGTDSESDRLTPLFVGFPSLMHGYFGNALSRQAQNGTLSLNQLTGSRMLVANVEMRVPFTGPKRLSRIKSGFLLSDLNFFFDGGVAWDSETSPVLKLTGENFDERVPVFSAGAGLRINLFGYMVVEPYYAFPFQRGEFQAGVFGVNFTPGW